MKKFLALGDELHVGEGKLLFPHPIAQIVNFGAIAVVRLDVPPGSRFNENVFGVSSAPRKLWQIGREPHVYDDSPYTNIHRQNDLVLASNWDGLTVSIEPATGDVIDKCYGR